MSKVKEKAPVNTPEPSQAEENHTSRVTYLGTKIKRKLLVARGDKAACENWETTPVEWDDFVKELSNARIMPCTVEEYHAAPDAQRNKWKDGPGFVGGGLTSAARKRENCAKRDMLTFDLEYPKKKNPVTGKWEKVGVLPDDIIDRVHAALPCEFFLYSTPSSKPGDMRYRVVVPLSRPVEHAEYNGLMRFLSDRIGMTYVDSKCFSVVQFMYFPARPRDLQVTTVHNEGDWLQVDQTIESFGEIWNIPAQWPGSASGEAAAVRAATHGHEATDPFVRAVNKQIGSIRDAIDTYLPDVYEADGADYTYIGASGVRGLKIIADKEVAYSHHESDPASDGHCKNAFDLIRVHKFGHMDSAVPAGESPGVYPSYGEMYKWADEHVPDYKIEMTKYRGEEVVRREADATAKEASGDPDAWMSRLALNSRGNVSATIGNFREIIRSDPRAPFRVAYNMFSHRQQRVNHDGSMVQWEDTDDSEIREHCETLYGIHSISKCDDGIKNEMRRRAFDPLKDYLHGLKWDGESRLDRMLIDFMGAEDDQYSREISRSWMLGAVERGLLPGNVPSKFDYMLILKGNQGVGKSTFFKMLARNIDWYTDSIDKLEADKDTRMTLLGKWIIEIGELAGMSKAEVKHVKMFLSAEKDDFRPPYGRQMVSQPRRCVFAGSSNDIEILRDATGNRRFFVLDVKGYRTAKTPLTPELVDQLWAEAVHLHNSGAKAEPSDWLKLEVAKRNAAFEVTDEWEAPVVEYLTRSFPHGWHKMSRTERNEWLTETRMREDMAPELAKATADANGWAELPFVCRKELFDHALDMDYNTVRPQDTARIDAIIRKQGDKWLYGADKKQRISGYAGHERVWYRK